MDQNELLDIYFEETNDNLEEAEAYIIGLEKTFSMDNFNSLFRCIHSIKGSSAAVNFDELSSLAHKLEDILNYIRDGKFEFDNEISNLCINCIDQLRVLFQMRRISPENKIDNKEIERSLKLQEEMDMFLQTVKEEKNSETDFEEDDLMEFIEKDISDFSKTYFIRLLFDVENPMQSITRFMIVNSLNESGKIVYSYPSVNFMVSSNSDEVIQDYECVYKTNIDYDKLLSKVDIPFINGIKITYIDNEVLRNTGEDIQKEKRDLLVEFFDDFMDLGNFITDTCWCNKEREKIDKLYIEAQKILELDSDNKELVTIMNEVIAFINIQVFIVEGSNMISLDIIPTMIKLYQCLISKLYDMFKNKVFFKYLQLKKDEDNIERLEILKEKMDRDLFRYVLIDINDLEIIENNELKKLINLNKFMSENGIQVVILNGGIYRRRIYNILESIIDILDIKQYYNETHAMCGLISK